MEEIEIKYIVEEGGKMLHFGYSSDMIDVLVSKLDAEFKKNEKIVGFILFIDGERVGSLYRDVQFKRHKKVFLVNPN